MCSSPTATLPPAPLPPPGPGRPKDMTKRAAILDAARQMFTQCDFDGVSMDQIAAAAGVSKLTVYNHFGDKDALFTAVIRYYCEQSLPTTLFQPAPEIPLREVLLGIARTYFSVISSEEALSGHRVMCSPRLQNSPLPRRFWDAGPVRVQADFADLLRRRHRAGELDIARPEVAAAQFFALVRGMPYEQLVFGCCDPDAPPDISAHLCECVELFLRAYAARPPGIA